MELLRENNFGVCFVIFGAGPSGLATAYKLLEIQSNIPVILVEKKGKVGGLSGTFAWKECSVDYGPHRLSSALPQVVDFVKDLIGPDLLELKSKHMVYLNKTFFQFPPRIIDFLKFRLILLTIFSIVSLVTTKIKMLVARFDSLNFEDTIKSKFGSYFVNNILGVMIKKVWPGEEGGALENMDKEFIRIRFQQVTFFEILRKIFKLRDNLNPKVSYYPRYGYGQIWDTMLNRMFKKPNFYFCPNSELNLIELNNESNEIIKIGLRNSITSEIATISSNEILIASSIPIDKLNQLIKSKNTYFETKKFELETVSLRLYLYLLNKSQILKARTYIFPQPDVPWNRIFEQNMYSRLLVPEGKSLLVVDLSYAGKPDNIKILDGREFHQVPSARLIFEELVKTKLISRNDLVDMGEMDIPYAYLRPSAFNAKALHEIKTELQDIRNLFLLGRFGAGVYNNADFAIKSGFELAEKLWEVARDGTNTKQRTQKNTESWNHHHEIWG